VVSLADIIRAVAENLVKARALLSVSGQARIVELARELVALGWRSYPPVAPREALAPGRASPWIPIEQVTGFPRWWMVV